MKKIILYTIISCFFLPIAYAQGVLKVDNSTYLNASGTVYIKIDNADFNVQGTFTPSTSIVEMSGDNNSTPGKIIGAAQVPFNDLKINRSMENVRMDQDVLVDGTLTFSSGNLDLNGNDLSFGSSGSISGESETSRVITSSTGEVIFTTSLNNPNQANPGNLGALITSSADLGSTTVKRGHTVQTNAGGKSIERYFDISPTNNSGLDATLRFQYLDAELNGIPENELEFWKQSGGVWSYEGFTSRDGTSNYVELTGIDAFSLWTVTNQANALPAELLNFSATPKNQSVQLRWTTASEVNLDYFEVERTTNGVDFLSLERVNGKGGLGGLNQYEAIDYSPVKGLNYYRLKMVDFDNRLEYSEMVSVDMGDDTGIQIFPNPTNGHLEIKGDNLDNAQIQISDNTGKVIRVEMLNQSSVDISDLPNGIYFLRVTNDHQIFEQKIIKK